MKVLLNLLPERHKAIIRKRYYDRFFLRQTIIAFCIGVFYLGMLGSIYFIVWQNRKVVDEMNASSREATTEAHDLSKFESTFREMNALSARSDMYYAGHLSWTELLTLFDSLIPDGISLTSLSTKEYQVFLSGTAKTRDDFLVLENKLKGNSCFSDFKIPVSNLFSSANVEFQMDFSVHPDCLKRSFDL
ncbi:MAG: PilN domain-containing protein [Candidatus Moraniibacteriota bacterium]